MKLDYRTGDILKCVANTLINPVNCLGVMEAGLAKQFKEKFPEACEDYRKEKKNYFPFTDVLHEFEENGKTIINFPTKWHYSQPSDMKLIEGGLDILSNRIYKLPQPIAIPALGCGIGMLSWNSVHELIKKHLTDENGDTIFNSKILVFHPQSFPTGKPIKTKARQ